MQLKQRNLASTANSVHISTDDVVWTDWSIEKAVKDGYKVSGWVYKAVSLISQNVASAPFVVRNKENQIEWEHPITKMLLNPHPYLSRVQFFELIVQWIQLAGNAYVKHVSDSHTVRELWPISPDRIKPIESVDNSSFVDGYKIKSSGGIYVATTEFTTDNVTHIALTNPENPLIGLAPLEACAKTVDSDVFQQQWNATAMQNRGVVEGVFTFKQPLDKKQSDSIMERIIRKFSGSANARKPLVIGSDAQYQRLSLTAAEMDFLESRKLNMNEIFIVFGVPPQLGGSQDSATYNNYEASMRIFWDTTIIPLLKLIATQFTQSFDTQLSEGYYVDFDLSDVSATREDEKYKAEIAKIYFEMGVPVKQINEKLELGFEEFEGWEETTTVAKQTTNEPTKEEPKEVRVLKLIPFEQRDTKAEALKRNKIAEGPVKTAFSELLTRQEKSVLEAIKKNEDPVDAIKEYKQELTTLVTNVTISVASQFANTVVVDQRGNSLNFEKRGELEDELIQQFLEEEQYILEEVSGIQGTSTELILDQIKNAAENGYSYEQLRKALEDTGVFSPERALRISRTEVGTAASIGQIASATNAGADYKTWQTAGTETRQAHVNRQGEEVKLAERFSAQISSIGPRFPLDPQISVSDRINCDCFLTFRVD